MSALKAARTSDPTRDRLSFPSIPEPLDWDRVVLAPVGLLEAELVDVRGELKDTLLTRTFRLCMACRIRARGSGALSERPGRTDEVPSKGFGVCGETPSIISALLSVPGCKGLV
ncbi:MAG: hypothetical protein KDK78_02510 [Chlamydiia bacterium]|nr:hypothetical protein [Chlamydiia bacterium]